ncbi:unnamed protein product [Notodromas monacha]|uniref:Uncharacterized protein n=1 Tax=Notodromas monacha TaxID=399045 RepID=A0A7R9GD66_9CRUS|nr:unnamed protein product [Notodromas monacha]CAG0918368.1 unnamed protein product [Notodromas monacha]
MFLVTPEIEFSFGKGGKKVVFAFLGFNGEAFQREVPGKIFKLTHPPNDDVYPPNLITDLMVTTHPGNQTIELTWTAPGGDFNKGKGIGGAGLRMQKALPPREEHDECLFSGHRVAASMLTVHQLPERYELRYAGDWDALRGDHFPSAENLKTRAPHPHGTQERIVFSAGEYGLAPGKVFYFAIRAHDGWWGPVSRPVRAYLKPAPTLKPPSASQEGISGLEDENGAGGGSLLSSTGGFLSFEMIAIISG